MSWQNSIFVKAKNSLNKNQESFISIEKVYSNSENLQGVELFVSKGDLSLELDPDSVASDQVKFKFDARNLLIKSKYPQLIKIKAYTKDAQANETIIQIINSSIFNLRQAQNFKFTIAIPATFSSNDLWLDIYDAQGNLQESFKQYLEKSSSQEASNLENADCDYTRFGDCQLNYILSSISYQATASKKAETVISKEASGKYTLSLPLVKAKNLKMINRLGSSVDSGNGSGGNQGNGLSSAEVINLVKAGDFSFTKIKLEEKELNTSPVPANGTLEFDGSKLYLTENGRREEIAKEGPPGAAGAAGIPGQKGDDGSFSGGDATIDGILTFAGGGRLEAPNINGASLTSFMKLTPRDDPPASPITGSLYQDSSPALCVYMNNIWTKLAGTGTCIPGTDNDPVAFDFTDILTTPSTLVTSNIVTVTGFDNAPISISGTGNPEYSIDSAAFTNSNGVVYQGQTVQLRLTSNGAPGQVNSATLTIGGISDIWNVVPISCPTNFVFIPGSAGFDSFGNVSATYAGGWCVSQYTMTPYNTTSWTRDGANGWHYQTSSGVGKKVTAKGNGGDTFPISYITRDEAATACASDLVKKNGTVLTNGKLLTVYWWSKISQIIVDDGINWSGGTPGSGNLSRGNAASGVQVPGLTEGTSATQPTGGTFYYTGAQGRAWRMGTGEGSVYDWAGNIFEWFDDLHNNSTGALYKDIDGAVAAYIHDNPNGSADITVIPSEFASHDNIANGVGRIYINNTPLISGTTYAARFGGGRSDGSASGAFSSYWGNTSSSVDRSSNIGFRCIIPSQ